MNHEARIGRVTEELPATDIDALLITNLTNVRYLTGFSGTNGQLLVTPSGAVFLSDPRYSARASELVRGAEVSIYRSKLKDVLPERLRSAGVLRLGFEATAVTVATRDDLGAALEGIDLVPTRDIVESHRRAKDSDEIELAKRAVAIADQALSWVLDRLAPGRSEREVALELEMHVRSLGADDVSFEPIVASGPLSAHIHHTPGARKLEQGDVVLLDLGALVDGYCSDLTRTVILGSATTRHRETYERVLEAQTAGIDAVQAGASGASVDAAGRSVIDETGEGDAFGHGLGHGVGLDIHEAPRLHWESEDVLSNGDVVTIEPGIYHEHWGGIRIEDCVLVTGDGGAVLTAAPKKELIEL